MAENEAVKKFKFELVDSIPKALVYSMTAFVIWLFTKFLFVPLGNITLYSDVRASSVIVAVAILTILVIILKILKEIRDICDAIAGIIAYSIDRNTATLESQVYQRAVRSLAYVLVAAIAFLFFSSLLNEIHPALSGIVLIVMFFWAVGTLYSAGMLLSDKIESKVKKTTSRMLSVEDKAETEKSGESKVKKVVESKPVQPEWKKKKHVGRRPKKK
ncbi:Uncharacterised protein [uncultured archaeon]|nr:Uncharacterised protein [uncultured archaeon]